MLIRLFIIVGMFFVTLSALADDAVAKIIKSQGDASAVNDANQKRALARGDDIFTHDTIETSPTGFVTMRFTDGTVIDLAASTKYVVKEYNYNPNDPKKDKFSTEVVEGGFRAITGGIGTRSPTAFTAKARLTTLTVRGTYFYMMAPHCPPAQVQTHQDCDNVLQFTIQGTTAINYKGNEYIVGPDQANSTFDLQNGTVKLSKTIPTTLPMVYSGSVDAFKKAVQVEAQTTGSATPSGTPPAATPPSGGGGGGNSPCGTLNAVGNSLPKSASP